MPRLEREFRREAPVILTMNAGSKGRAVAGLDADGVHLEPGESAIIPVQWDFGALGGQVDLWD